MKRKIVSTIFYILNLGLFIFPWIIVGDEKFHVGRLMIEQTLRGGSRLTEMAGLPANMEGMVTGGVSLQLFFMLIYLVFSFVYMGLMWKNKRFPANLVVLMMGVIISYLHNTFPGTLGTIAPGNLTTIVSLLFILPSTP